MKVRNYLIVVIILTCTQAANGFAMNVEKNYNIALGINGGIKPIEYSFLEDRYILPVVSLSPQISYKRCLGFINHRCRIGLQLETSVWDVEINQQGVKGDISRQDVSVYFGSTIYQFWQKSRSYSLSYSVGYTAGRTEIEYHDGLSLLSTEAGNFISLSGNIGFSEKHLLSLRIASGYLWDMQYQSKRSEQPLDDVKLGDYRSPDFSGGMRWYYLLSKSVDLFLGYNVRWYSSNVKSERFEHDRIEELVNHIYFGVNFYL